MKKLIIFLISLMMLTLLVSGCQASVKRVTVGNMSLNISSDWKKEKIAETSDINIESDEYNRFEHYCLGSTDNDTHLFMFSQDIKGYFESIGAPYSNEPPDPNYYWCFPKVNYLVPAGTLLENFSHDAQQKNYEDPVMLKINDCEVWEQTCEYTRGDVSYVANAITIFGENDWGCIFLVRPKAKEQYYWNVIKDSVRFE